MFGPPKPAFIGTIEDGEFGCDKCTYKTNNEEHLKEHSECYHPVIEEGQNPFILYFQCDGSLNGRNSLAGGVSVSYLDMTGGQAAFEDGDLTQFGTELVLASRASGYKIYNVYRMHDPGLGLMLINWLIDEGLELGIFEEYELPEDVKVPAAVENNEMGAEFFIFKKVD